MSPRPRDGRSASLWVAGVFYTISLRMRGVKTSGTLRLCGIQSLEKLEPLLARLDEIGSGCCSSAAVKPLDPGAWPWHQLLLWVPGIPDIFPAQLQRVVVLGVKLNPQEPCVMAAVLGRSDRVDSLPVLHTDAWVLIRKTTRMKSVKQIRFSDEHWKRRGFTESEYR